MSSLDALRARLATVYDLNKAASVLEWDQETYMPDGATEARAHQLTTLRSLSHEHFTDDETGALLERAEVATQGLEAQDPARALVRVAQRDYDRATKLPARLVAEFATATARAKHAWQAARADDDFAQFAPHLERVIALSVEKADALGATVPEARYDILLDEYEPGMTAAEVAREFAELREGLVPLVEAIADAPHVDDAFLHAPFDEAAQWAFGLEVAQAFGYDLAHGRQDRSAHPFSTTLAIDDVRITTRIDPNYFPSGFFGTLHETGHALYERGVSPDLARSPLASGTSLGMHESQSRLWENQVGRSRPFWQRWYPKLQDRFPAQLSAVPVDAYYRAINRVGPSFIRVEADEVTYNLHVMLRFEIERALIDGSLSVADVPAAWNAAMKDYLGVTPPTDREGCLQDIHWSIGLVGYFPTYTLGTLMSAQLFEAAQRDLGDLAAAFAEGTYLPLREWLRDQIHQHGRVYTATELLRHVCGTGLDAAPWLKYAHAKYALIYDLAL
ncbi:MAG: carboxypeptidase M32 [Bacteroidota bacterium]